VFSAELRAVYAPQIEAPMQGVSPLAENLLLLRFVELQSEIRRVVSVMKLRDSDFDPRIREFLITSSGLQVGESFGGTEAILTGVARRVPRNGEAAGARPERGAQTRPAAKKKGAKRGTKARGKESRKRR
jgi:circadian clock protein KaiC